MVEGGEVVVVELDLGSLHHPVAEADEDVLDLTLGADQEVLGGARRPRGTRQGDVDRAGGERALQLGSLELRLAGLELAPRAPGAPRSPADADRPALLGRELRDPAQDRGQLGLAAEVADPQLLERAGVRGGGDRRRGLAAQGARSARAGSSGRPTISVRARSQPPPRRSATPARPRGAGSSRGGRSAGRPRPAAPPAPRRGRRSPPASSPRRPAPVRDQRRPPACRDVADRGPRRRPREDRAHARPHRLRRVRVGAAGAEHDRAVAQRVGGADDGAHVAGVADAVQVDARARRPARTRPAR